MTDGLSTDLPDDSELAEEIQLASGVMVRAEPGWVLEGPNGANHIRAAAAELVEATGRTLTFELRESGQHLSILRQGPATVIEQAADDSLTARELE